MKYEDSPGITINQFFKYMVEQSNSHNEIMEGSFNGNDVIALPNDDPETLARHYMHQREVEHLAYLKSDEYAKKQKQRAEEDSRRMAEYYAALEDAPATITLRDPAAFEDWCKHNQDGYGKAVVSFASDWARMMEKAMLAGKALSEVASSLSFIAGYPHGLTGFQYGCAVHVLSQCWKHGEKLRQWHNLHTQIGDEGEKANAGGGVLNPALLCMGR